MTLAALSPVAPALAQAAVIAVMPEGEAPFVGAYTPEGPRLREQLWLVPTGAGQAPRLRATVFRPQGAGPFPLAVIAHPTAGQRADRLAYPMPTFYHLSRQLVERGYAVAIPVRRGYGGSEGIYAESIGTCAAPVYERAGMETASDIEATIAYLRRQTFVADTPALAIGIGGGAWGLLALAMTSPNLLAGVVGFGTGRGTVGPNDPGKVCAPDRLFAAARGFGEASRVPMLWLQAEDDRSIPPEIARDIHKAFADGGGTAAFKVVGRVGQDQGHNLVGELRAVALWRPHLMAFLDGLKR